MIKNLKIIFFAFLFTLLGFYINSAFGEKIKKDNYETKLACYRWGMIDTMNSLVECTDFPIFKNWKDFEDYLETKKEKQRLLKEAKSKNNKKQGDSIDANSNYFNRG